MKKVLSLLTTLAMLVSVAVVPMSASADTTAWDGVTIDTEWAGEGTEASPYLITSAAELAGLAKTLFDADSTTQSTAVMPLAENYVKKNSSGVATLAVYFAYTDKHFKLTTDIDLGKKEWTPIGRLAMRFNGIFDGDGHVVKNVYMRREYSAMGLFGGTGTGARIVNLGVDGVDVLTNVQTSGIVDYIAGGDLTKGQNRVSGIGGLVGVMTYGGTAEKPMLENCFVKNATLKIKTKGDTTHYGMGGLFGTSGYNVGGSLHVKNCYVKNVDFAGVANVGTLFGSNTGVLSAGAVATTMWLTNCYAGGNISMQSTHRTNTTETVCYNFGYLYARTNCTYTDVYSTVNSYNTRDSIKGDGEQCTDKAGVVSNFATLGGWSADNEKSPINDGYPILAWENTWESTWDGTADTTWSGSGTESDPYLITSAEELAGLASKIYNATAADATSETPSAPVRATNAVTPTAIFDAYTGIYFKLTKDINLNNKEWLPIGRMGMRFNGEFDGGNHVISNLKISTPYYAMGLFGATSEDATISNLGLKKARVVFSNATPADYDSTKAEPSRVAYNAINNSVVTRTLGAASLVGIFGKTEIINCFAKYVEVNNTNTGMNSYAIGGLLGGGWSVNNSGNNQRITATNCYITDVNVGGNASHKGLFVGTNSHDVDNNVHRLLYYFTNCYVGGEIVESDSVYEFGRSYGLNGSGLMSNCFTTATNCKANNFGFACYVLTKTDKAGIEKALVTGNNVWNLDSVKNPINGGYPVLGWEKTWTVDTDPMSFYKGAGATVEGGKVTKVTVIQSDSAVSGTVIVAVYNGTRFENSSVETAKNGEITLTTPLAVDSGDTIKVFIWETLEGLRPLGVEYITTPAPSYSVEDGVMTVEYAGVLPDNLEFEDIPEETIASVKKIVIDDGVTGIGDNIFSEFTSIESVEIPRTVEEISDTAFPAADFTIYGCANGAAEAYADANNKEFLLKELRILSIGNSHTADHGRWNAEIWGDIADAGIETEIVYERITNSSHGMYYSASTDSAGYAISHYVQAHNPSSVNYAKYAKLVDEEWDLVLIQDYRESCVGIDGFTDAMAETTKWLRAAQPNAKIGWIVDWNDRTDSKDNAVLQQKFYDKTVTTVNNVLAMTSDAPDYIIPMGTAMQNARATYLGSVMNAAGCCVNEGYTMGKETQYNVLERDNTHLSLELGRYMMGAAVFGYIYDLYQDKLIGGDTVDFCDSLVTMPVEAGANEWKGEFTDSIWDIVEEVTENTIANPWTITNSVYTVDPAIAKAVEVENATYTDFTPAGIVATIKSLGNGFTVSESDVTIDGDTATVKFLYGYSEKIVTISK